MESPQATIMTPPIHVVMAGISDQKQYPTMAEKMSITYSNGAMALASVNRNDEANMYCWKQPNTPTLTNKPQPNRFWGITQPSNHIQQPKTMAPAVLWMALMVLTFSVVLNTRSQIDTNALPTAAPTAATVPRLNGAVPG